jgi:hypothetical protein
MLSWEEAVNVAHYELWERRLAKLVRRGSHYWQEACLAVHGVLHRRWIPWPRPREENHRMSTLETTPVHPAMLGRALLAKLDEPTVDAITAAIREEIRQEVHEAAVAEARATLEQEFAARRERILDEAARFKALAQDDAEALLDQQVQAALQEQERDWQDRLDTLRGRVRDFRERAERAESVVTALVSQLTGGADKPPVYLHSGGRGLTALDLGAVNAILARAGVRLRSEASPSPRVVACQLADGRTVGRTRFRLTTVPVSGEAEPDAEDEASTPTPLALSEAPQEG